MNQRYLFGQPVLAATPNANGPRKYFILGAYPSALHVGWYHPDGECLIRAVAIDNEPEPFWNGCDEELHIDAWKKEISFKPSWGIVKPCTVLNGSSGDWLDKNVLQVLNISRHDAWITDCLDTYHESDKAAGRLESEKVVSFITKQGIPQRSLNPHPSENNIVESGLSYHRDRLLAELEKAHPACIITLGNAALRVLNGLVTSNKGHINKLRTEAYGTPINIKIFGRDVEWYPLAHPAAPPIYQNQHRLWMAKRFYQ